MCTILEGPIIIFTCHAYQSLCLVVVLINTFSVNRPSTSACIKPCFACIGPSKLFEAVYMCVKNSLAKSAPATK